MNNTYCEEFSGVLVSIVDTDRSAAKSDVEANSEVSGLEWHVRAVLLQDHLSGKEWTLHGSTVHDLWLSDQN